MPNQKFPLLTLAVNHYDRHLPFLDGTVSPEGFELKAMSVGQSVPGEHGMNRHPRMLKDGEFDYAEVSLSSYLMAKDRGLPFTAIPIFPRRLFSLSQMYVHTESGIVKPSDLEGKKIGLSSYQTTVSVLAKGDLFHRYGVSWKKVHWITNKDEIIPHIPDGISLTRASAGKSVGQMLADGDIDAMISPHPPQAFLDGDKQIKRLFDNARLEEETYVRERGYYPIMHIVAVRNDVVERYPTSALAMVKAFEHARRLARYDPNWSIMVWGRQALEAEQQCFARDPWINGVSANRRNLEHFIQYSYEQGLISQLLAVDDMFHGSVLHL